MDLILKKLFEGNDLGFEETRLLISEIMRGEHETAVIAGILMALKIKGEHPEEIGGSARALQDASLEVTCSRRPLLDTCGTGGDGRHTINISTASAIVLASCGVAVAKHGNRAVSSRAGSADVLETLGVAIELGPEANSKLLDELGICFMFAPLYHPAMKNVMPVRKALGTRTLFNLIGPLSNPARPTAQVLGVYDPALLEPMAQALLTLGCERAFVVHGAGLDELALHAPTSIVALDGGGLRSLEVDPTSFGIEPASPKKLAGGDADENAQLLRDIFSGADTGPRASAIGLNAAAGLILAGAEDDWSDAYKRCMHSMAGGDAATLLARWVEGSRDLA